MNVKITEGARLLKGIPHRLVLFDRYSISKGNELIHTLFGSGNLILAILILFVVAMSIHKKRRIFGK